MSGMMKPKTQSPTWVPEAPAGEAEHLGGTVGDHTKTASLEAGLRAFLQPLRARRATKRAGRVAPRRRARRSRPTTGAPRRKAHAVAPRGKAKARAKPKAKARKARAPRKARPARSKAKSPGPKRRRR